MIGERVLRQLDDVLTRSPLALVALDSNYRISYWSARAQQLLGFSKEEMIGRHPSELSNIHPEDVDPVLAFESRISSESLSSLTMVARSSHKDGTMLTIRWTTVAVQDDERYRAIAFGEDITETVEARAALSESEERFRSLFEYNPETVMFFDPDGRIAAVNAAVSRFGPLPRERLIGMHYSDFIDPDEVARHGEFMQRALEGETLSYHTRAHTYHGVPLQLEVTTVPVTRDGKIEGVFSILRDETEQYDARIRIEDQERQLAESEARLRSLFSHNPDPVIALELDGTMVDCNDAAVRVSGLARGEILGRQFSELLPSAARPRVQSAFEKASIGIPAFCSFAVANGEGRPVEVDGTIIPQYSQGQIVGIYAVFQDITERRAAQRQAEMQQERIRNLYFIAASGDRPELRIRASLEMGLRAFGLTYGAVVDITGPAPAVTESYRSPGTAKLSDAAMLARARAAFETAQPGVPVVSAEGVVSIRIDVGGTPFGLLVFGSNRQEPPELSETDADLLGLISTLIAGAIETDRSRAQLRSLAYYDTLTGLPNRAYLSEKVRDAIEVAQSRLGRAALLFLDLDGFKDVNDTLGHARGDRLLQLVAQRLSDAVDERDAVARMGGDEFVVLLPHCQTAEAAREVAERIVASISEPFMLDEYEHFISVSIGIAMYPDDGRDDQTLIKNADIAMSRAKDRGRNGYFFFNSTLEAPIHMRLSQEKLLRRALELEEFVVFYQPQVDLRSGRVVSVEALVRWNHAKSGLIEPSHFIPSAEISGLIVQLGDWVLATAARQVREWQPKYGRLRLAVNLSARQFHDRQLRKRITEALERAQFPPERFEVEITETVAMSDAAQTAQIVRDLSDSGIRIALDDFGTGYSSLAYLRSFDLDVLKVDGSFVAGIGRSASDETIVNTVIGMAHSLGLQVVAEGVETQEQMNFLRGQGCDVVQGYAIAPALPAAEFENFIAHREKASASGYGE